QITPDVSSVRRKGGQFAQLAVRTKCSDDPSGKRCAQSRPHFVQNKWMARGYRAGALAVPAYCPSTSQTKRIHAASRRRRAISAVCVGSFASGSQRRGTKSL